MQYLLVDTGLCVFLHIASISNVSSKVSFQRPSTMFDSTPSCSSSRVFLNNFPTNIQILCQLHHTSSWTPETNSFPLFNFWWLKLGGVTKQSWSGYVQRNGNTYRVQSETTTSHKLHGKFVTGACHFISRIQTQNFDVIYNTNGLILL